VIKVNNTVHSGHILAKSPLSHSTAADDLSGGRAERFGAKLDELQITSESTVK